MNIQENVNRIKQVMGLIVEQQSEEDLKKSFEDKFGFPINYNKKATIQIQGDNIVATNFSTNRNSHYTLTYNSSNDFYTYENIDGPYKGSKKKVFKDVGSDVYRDEFISKSELETKFEEKVKNFSCLIKYNPDYVRQTSDGKIIAGYRWGNNHEQIVYFNLDDNTYTIKGGRLDGEQGKFTCDGENVEWGKVTKSGTKKTVSDKRLFDSFDIVDSEYPITYGMRDHTPEPEHGLIYQLQKKLKELNLYTGEPDGQFGPLTLKAVKDFQKTGKDADGKPLVVDGKVGPKTIASLGLTD